MLLPFLGGLFGALHRERRYDGESLLRFRNARLAAMIAHARGRTALYRDRLRHVPEHGPIQLSQIEPITKTELMDRWSESIEDGALSLDEIQRYAADPARAGRPFGGRYMVATTSGTTGRLGYFVQDTRSFAEMNGVLLARVLRYRLVPREVLRFSFGRRYRMAMVIATGGHFITRLVSDFRPPATRAMVDMHTCSILDPIEKVVHELNRFRPHYLHGYPTFLEVLAHERLAGRLSIDPEFLSLGSEPFSASARRSIARAFPRAQISETYGATECLAMANQCSAGRLHINEDTCILEPVDKDGKPVPVGVPSAKVYLTNLVNRAQPLLRYELSDSITLSGDACPCGSPMPSIRIEGRADDTIYLADESGRFSAHPPVPFEALFLNVPGLRQYQLVHEIQNELRVRFVPGEKQEPAEVERALRRSFEAYLGQHHLGRAVRLVFEPTDALDRNERGHKLRQIYSKVPRPLLAS